MRLARYRGSKRMTGVDMALIDPLLVGCVEGLRSLGRRPAVAAVGRCGGRVPAAVAAASRRILCALVVEALTWSS